MTLEQYGRKMYCMPQLVVYGTLWQLTETKGGNRGDGGGGAKPNTRVRFTVPS